MNRLSTILLLSIVCLMCSTSQAQTGSTALANDLRVLNYALTLENLENQFYLTMQTRFNVSQFVAAGYNTSVYSYLAVISSHETAHVNLLTSVLQSLGATAAVQCTYNFSSITTVQAYLATAQVLENTGTSAYDGAINGITSSTYAQVAATIATVEARHAAYLNQLNNQIPFSNVLEPTLTPTAVITALTAPGSFVTSCPYNITLPTVRPNGVNITSNTGPIITTPAPTYTVLQAANDLAALNYALTLENLEAAFYNQYQAIFTNTSFIAAGIGLTNLDYLYFGLIQAHENAHVAALVATIIARGGVPVNPCNYTFNVTSVQTYIAVARILENTGVSAYDGAVNTITDTGLQQLAATIATVEARHASYLNQINGAIPFPNITDTGVVPAQILGNASAFISGSCPQATGLILPVVLGLTSVIGDPSFVGFKGEHFQVHGIEGRIFNLISAETLQVNSKFGFLEDGDCMTNRQMQSARSLNSIQRLMEKKSGKIITALLPNTAAWSHDGTYLTEIGMKLGSQKVHIIAGKYEEGMTATLNGVSLKPISDAVELPNGMSLHFSSPHVITITHPILQLTIVNSDRFFNIDNAELMTTDTENLEGLLGQTARDSFKLESTAAFRYHQVYDYLVRTVDVFDDDFVQNKFTATM